MNRLFLSVFLRRRGFTLTELMAVVIIVAILAAVAAGSYKQAVERSHFSEGLIAANTVLQGVERYYADLCNEGSCPVSGSFRPAIKNLDISLANQKTCPSSLSYCAKTKYFEITVQYGGYVDAKRMKGSNAGDYTIRVYPDSFGSNQRTDAKCIYRTDAGKDLCVSVGYATCDTATQSCTK